MEREEFRASLHRRGETMIRACDEGDFDAILAIVNDAAEAYRDVIPADRWKEPYMPTDELRREIAAGIAFYGEERAGGLAGVMGIQPVRDVVLIRHAYVRTALRNQGIGGALLGHVTARTDRPILIGTWAAARWAVRFYEKHGFGLIEGAEKDCLLQRYWSIPARQVETSVVLGDARWLEAHPPPARAEEEGGEDEA